MNEKIKILLAEDDSNLGNLLSTFLKAKNFDVTLCINGEIALERFKSQVYDFVILDVMMPIMDGFSVAKEIRETDQETPILFLTAKSMQDDKLKGFSSGADDYMTKPFNMEELVARINAVLKRTYKDGNKKQTEYEIGDIKFDYTRQIITINGEVQKLTTKENELFYILIRNKDEILDRNAALRHVWGDDNYFNGRSMDVYITKLRKHIKSSAHVEILNVHGKGFKLLEK
ncbi:DNA-binding response regulator [Putridiphycobacter roseus]|uniref:DNA-binding response regulator n=1 Tax=Putridiphycobacter roseus TaxID=2219161 RepID=A0A2W1NFU7_9FLAO|nr:response regulator transcription factor [Putridiphycobacter roseus]PZE17963.1 DNA-binding response regulator [Putridiphycobacter roseus]